MYNNSQIEVAWHTESTIMINELYHVLSLSKIVNMRVHIVSTENCNTYTFYYKVCYFIILTYVHIIIYVIQTI